MLKFDLDVSSLTVMLRGMSEGDKKDALEAAGQVMILSTQVGYTKGIDPEGNKWAPNPSWYSQMKGGSSPLTGPTSKAVQGGRWSGTYEFREINSIRMRNALEKDVGSNSVTIRYMPSVNERAKLTQEGGSGTIELVNLKNGNTLSVNVQVQPREHLGIAENYARFGGKTDIRHIMDIFEDLVDKSIG